MSFAGITTALITPFKEGKIDDQGLRENIHFQIEEGVDKLLFLGTTGEGNFLSEEERKRVIAIALEEGKGSASLLLSCGDASTERSISKVIQAEKMGMDGVLVIAPYYCRPTQEGIFRHFEMVAKNTSLPIIIYNHPKRTSVEIELETVKRLAEIQNIVGIKDASGSIVYGAAVIEALPDFLFLAGDDLMTLPISAIGAAGLISVLSNLLPRRMKELVETRDRVLYQNLYPFITMSQIETNPVPIKAMMNLAGFPAGECRLPLTSLSKVNHNKLRDLLLNSSLIAAAAL